MSRLRIENIRVWKSLRLLPRTATTPLTLCIYMSLMRFSGPQCAFCCCVCTCLFCLFALFECFFFMLTENHLPHIPRHVCVCDNNGESLVRAQAGPCCSGAFVRRMYFSWFSRGHCLHYRRHWMASHISVSCVHRIHTTKIRFPVSWAQILAKGRNRTAHTSVWYCVAVEWLSQRTVSVCRTMVMTHVLLL